jgi:hypothetical protein
MPADPNPKAAYLYRGSSMRLLYSSKRGKVIYVEPIGIT